MFKVISICCVLVLILSFQGCETNLDNSITITNNAAEQVILNIYGKSVVVEAGEVKVMKELNPGTYTYSTSFTIPASATSASSTGAASGSVIVKAGTKINLIYTSFVVSLDNNITYTLSASISSNDAVTTSTTTTSSATSSKTNNITGP
jgi:hypothetical protein